MTDAIYFSKNYYNPQGGVCLSPGAASPKDQAATVKSAAPAQAPSEKKGVASVEAFINEPSNQPGVWDKGQKPAAAEPAPSVWAKLMGNWLQVSDQGDTGCSAGKPVSSVCEGDPSPHNFVDNQKAVPALYDPADLANRDKGIDLVWTINYSNCDSNYDKQYLRVYFTVKNEQGVQIIDRTKYQDYFPDQLGNIIVKQHFDDPNTYPSSVASDFYSYDPNTGKITDKPKAITLYTAATDPNAPPLPHVNDCFYSVDPQQLNSTGGIVSSVGGSLDFGQSARFSVTPRECDTKSFDDLEVFFTVDGGKPIRATKSTDGSGTFYIDYTFNKKDGNIAIGVSYTDIKRQSSTLEAGISIYVAPTKYSVEILPTSTTGFLSRRPITLNAGFISGVPATAVTFSWEVRDPKGQLVTDQTGQPIIFPNSQVVDFTPPTAGAYSATLTISGDKFIRPVTIYKEVPVYPFSAPQLFPSGNQSPKSGSTVSYGLQLLPVNRQRSAEDDGATCTWTLSHINPTTNKPVVDIDSQVKNCSQPLSVTFPAVSVQTSYLLEAKVVGGDNAYGIDPLLSTSIPINLYPDAVNQPQANFSVSDNGAPYPGHEINFSGVLVNAPEGVNLTYSWEVLDNNDKPVTNQSILGQSLAYTFAASGPYKVKLSIFADGRTDPIATNEQSYLVYPFPEPAVKITINDNKPVYVNTQVRLSGLINRNLPEDQNATYAWTISHRELDPITLQMGDVVDLGSAVAQARTRDLLYTFTDSRTYTVSLTVTSSNGTSAIYTTSATAFLDVFLPNTGLPLAGFTNPTSANSGDPVTFSANNADEEHFTYTWDFNDPSDKTPGNGASPTHTFTVAPSQIATFNVKLTVASKDDPNLKNTSTQSITIVGPQGAATLRSFDFTPQVCQGSDPLAKNYCPSPATVNFSLAVNSVKPLTSAIIDFGDNTVDTALTTFPLAVNPKVPVEYNGTFPHTFYYNGRTTRVISVDVIDSAGKRTTVVPASSNYQFNGY
jgi:hypothetical protein